MRALVPVDAELTVSELATLAFTYFTVGVAGTVILKTAGTDSAVIAVSAVVVNAITTPLAFIAVLGSGGSVLAALISGWLVASRFGLLAAGISPHLWSEPWKRALAAFGCFDPNTAIALREKNDELIRRVYLLQTIAMEVPWYLGTAVGLLVGDRLGDPGRLGLDAVFPAAMLGIIWPQLRGRLGASIAALGAAIALVLLEITPGGVPALVAAGAALLALRPDVPNQPADADDEEAS